ncbi:MAG: 50S ribosomal protein L25/general stress protein Ctc [Alphaproteobacteria bacterium]|nr:MAG: 50S ribosomal protein L25/general stress protein Ctc [Alphaproteobacteria bacterium]
MTKVLKLAAENREGAGKGAARATRRADKIPAVIYGDKKDPQNIQVNPLEFNKLYHAGNFFTKLLDLDVAGKTIRTLPRDVQTDPLTDNVIHADFLRVSDKTRIRVSVPIHVKNEAKCPGLKQGGVLNLVQHEIEVTCLASDIPEYFEIDIEGMEMNTSVHISALKLPSTVQPVIRDRDFTVLAINPPTVVKEETPVAAAAATAEGAAPAEGAAAGAAAPAAGAAAPAAGKDAAKPAAPAKK